MSTDNSIQSRSTCKPYICNCGNSDSSQKSNNFSMVNNFGGLGRKDITTSFRPISKQDNNGYSNGVGQVLNKTFNIHTLNSIRADTLEKKINTIDQENSPSLTDILLKPNDFKSLSDVLLKNKSPGPMLTPDYFLSSGDQKLNANSESSNWDLKKGEYIDRSGSNSARHTPLTCEELTSRLVGPDEFTVNPFSNREIEENFDGLTEERHANYPSTSYDDHILTSGLNNQLVRSHSPNIETNNPLNAFFSTLGITERHNSILPGIPGGKDKIIPRLSNPDKGVMEQLRLSEGNRNGKISDSLSSDSEDAIKPLIPMESLPHKTRDGEKPLIAVFWDIENCQVSELLSKIRKFSSMLVST